MSEETTRPEHSTERSAFTKRLTEVAHVAALSGIGSCRGRGVRVRSRSGRFISWRHISLGKVRLAHRGFVTLVPRSASPSFRSRQLGTNDLAPALATLVNRGIPSRASTSTSRRRLWLWSRVALDTRPIGSAPNARQWGERQLSGYRFPPQRFTSVNRNSEFITRTTTAVVWLYPA